MKRITTLLLAVCLVLGSVGAAKADGIDVKVKGIWDFAFGWADNLNFTDSPMAKSSRNNDATFARQRLRTQINFIAGEHLQGVAYFEIGNLNWGRGGSSGRGSGGAIDADGVNIETRRLYVDWLIPNTSVSVRMGMQQLALPNIMGSPIFDTDVAAIVVSSPITDQISIAGFWMRPFDRFGNDWEDSDNNFRHVDDEVDVFGLLLPVKLDGINLTPYFVLGSVGNGSGIYNYIYPGAFGGINNSRLPTNADTAFVWWAGLNFELNMFDPLTFKMDFTYGRLNRNDLEGLGGFTGTPAGETSIGSKGWFLAAALDYAFDWGTPGIFGWYSTGDDWDDFNDDGWLGRIPSVGWDQGFTPTSFGLAGTYSIGEDCVISNTGIGMWGIGIQVADVSFLPDLSHTLRVAYYRGTNDEDMAKNIGNAVTYNSSLYLTKEDSVWEVNFDHQYKIYENLTAILEIGYLHLKADRDTWGAGDESENAWKAQLMFRYAF